MGQRFHVVRATEGVNGVGEVGFPLENELGVAGDSSTGRSGQTHRLVKGVGVQALSPAQHGGHRLHRGADDVVEGVLSRERPARGLTVDPQRSRLRIFWAKLPHQLRPQQPRGPQLGHLHQKVHADAEEKRQARRKLVHVQAL